MFIYGGYTIIYPPKYYNIYNMGKTGNCIKMLQLLNTGKLFKISELAHILETNPRNIIEYKKELESYGYFIDTVPGRYGGYKLSQNELIPSLLFKQQEKTALLDLFNYAMSKKDFINKNGISEVMGKIFSSLLIESTYSKGVLSVDKVNSSISENLIEKNYKIIAECIKNKKTIKIKYRWLKKDPEIIEVDPYQLFLYDNEWRFFAWNHNVDFGDNPIMYLKLTRVESIEITNKSFKVFKYFKASDYLNKNVFSQNGEMFNVVLIASGIRAKLIKEKQYGYNQICEDLPDGKVKVTLEMQKNPSTYNTILGFGDLVEVIEPEWLKDKIKSLALEIAKKYMGD